MARLPRYNLPGVPQHVILRGNNRSDIFATDEDYQFFKECLQSATEQYDCSLHAYVLMTNHAHLLLTPMQVNSISKAMQSIGRRYVQYFNYRQKRTGTLWEGRYKATLIDSERYLLTCYRYIELNPVRAGMVNKPGEYPWSSFLWHSEGEPDSLISDHAIYIELGRNAEERQNTYLDLFKTHLDHAILAEIRDASNKGWVLGTELFKFKMAEAAGRRVRPLAKGRRQRLIDNVSIENILNIIK